MTVSATLTLTVTPITPPSEMRTFISSITNLGTPDSGTESRGMALTIGSQPITLYKVGRWITAGNNQSHQIRVLHGPNWQDSFNVVPGGLATVNTSGATPGQFAYVDLQGPTVLLAGQSYFVMSDEHGGDVWHRDDTVVTTTMDATLTTSASESSLGSGVGPSGSGLNHPYVPLSFQYTVGVPIDYPAQVVGSVYGGISGKQFYTNNTGVASGTVTLNGRFNGSEVGNITYQWTLNGNAVSPVITGPAGGGLPWSFDTTTVADGTYIVYPNILDWDTDSAAFNRTSNFIIIANHGTSVAAGQLIPCATYTAHVTNPRPEFIIYDGVPNPVHNTYPIPYNFSPPVSNRDAPLYATVSTGPRCEEYYGNPQWVTTPDGGVAVHATQSLSYSSTAASYDQVVRNNTMDGTRLNGQVHGYTNYVEDPDVSGQWFGAEINGRIFKLDRSGTITTIFGPHRDRTQLTYHEFIASTDQIEGIRSNLGTYPPGVDALDGANDLCFDPRDHNILYVAAQLKHFIAKINIATKVCSIYAGVPESPGYTDGPSVNAKFNMPTSVIMAPSGIMYVSDQENSAIRRISANGATVDTLCGGNVGPAPTTMDSMTSPGAIHNVSGTIVMNPQTNMAPVTLSSPASLVAGQALAMQGGIQSNGGDPNNSPSDWHFKWIVANVIDSTHFNMIAWGYPNNPQSAWTISGSITLQEVMMDFYSAPGTVSFANAYVTFPQVIRFTSTGNIIVGEASTTAVRLIDLGASTITRIGCMENLIQANGKAWIWLDTDPEGTCGPVDDIILMDALASASHRAWRMSIAVSSVPGQPVYAAYFVGDGGFFPNLGPSVLMGFGHYPWAVAISRKESRFITTGMASWHPTVYRLKHPSDPDVDEWNNVNFARSSWDNGIRINRMGTSPGFPWGARPAFESTWGQFGATYIGNGPGPHTFEDLMSVYPTDEGLAGFIQSGMGGTTPRPELTGNDLRDFIYFVRRSTLQGSLGPTPTQAGPSDPDIAPPVILTVSASRLSGTSIQVTWTTNEPTIGLAGAGSTSQALQHNFYPMYSDIESAYSTSHTATITVISGMSPVHYTAIAKDRAGYIVHTADSTVI